MTMKLPTSDKTRLDHLDAILRFPKEADSMTPAEPDPNMETTTVSPSVSLPKDLINDVQKCQAKVFDLGRQTKALQEKIGEDRGTRNALVIKVRSFLRSYWKALTLFCETHPKARNPKAFYGLVDGNFTKASVNELIRLSKEVLLSASNAADAGMPIITLGDAQEAFAQTVAELVTVLTRLSQAEMDGAELSKESNEARVSCDSVLRAVAAFLRYSYRNDTPVEIRQKMRAYGFKFKNRDGEVQTADAVDVNQPSGSDEGQAVTGENQQ